MILFFEVYGISKKVILKKKLNINQKKKNHISELLVGLGACFKQIFRKGYLKIEKLIVLLTVVVSRGLNNSSFKNPSIIF